MVRYMRNDSAVEIQDKKPSTSLFDIMKDDVDPVSQLVARYNGSADPSQIMEWISKIVKDGDSAKLPFFRTTTPELVPENSNPLWSTSHVKLISTADGIKHNVHRIVAGGRSLSEDPRAGSVLLLAALLSFGGIWLRRSQPTSSSNLNDTRQTHDIPKEWRNRNRGSPYSEVPPSMTDEEPKGAYQMELSDSDNE